MTTRLEDALRETLDRLADEARPTEPPTGLAAAALRRAERRRVRRTALTALAAVVATFAVVVPTVELLRGEGPPPVTPPTATSAPPAPTTAPSPTPPPAAFDLGAIELPGGWMLGAAPGEGGFWVWDRTRTTYRQVPYQHVYPAPVGNYAVVVGTDGERLGVLDLGKDKVRWLDTLRRWSGPEWTADGSRFLMRSQTGSTHLLVVTARTGDIRPIPGTSTDVPDEAEPAFWMPGDTEVATWIDGLNWQRRSAETGRTEGVLAERQGVAARTDFAPDGGYVIGNVSDNTVLIDNRTGEPKKVLPRTYPGRAYWADAERVLLLDGQSQVVTMVDLDGREVGSYPLPADMDVDEGHNYTLIRT